MKSTYRVFLSLFLFAIQLGCAPSGNQSSTPGLPPPPSANPITVSKGQDSSLTSYGLYGKLLTPMIFLDILWIPVREFSLLLMVFPFQGDKGRLILSLIRLTPLFMSQTLEAKQFSGFKIDPTNGSLSPIPGSPFPSGS